MKLARVVIALGALLPGLLGLALLWWNEGGWPSSTEMQRLPSLDSAVQGEAADLLEATSGSASSAPLADGSGG